MVEQIKAPASQSSATGNTPRPAADAPPATESGKNPPQGGKAAPVAESEAIRSEQLQRRIRDFLTNNNRSLSFRVDGDSGRTIITVFNKETGEIVREIPPENLREIARQIGETAGVFIRTIA